MAKPKGLHSSVHYPLYCVCLYILGFICWDLSQAASREFGIEGFQYHRVLALSFPKP